MCSCPSPAQSNPFIARLAAATAATAVGLSQNSGRRSLGDSKIHQGHGKSPKFRMIFCSISKKSGPVWSQKTCLTSICSGQISHPLALETVHLATGIWRAAHKLWMGVDCFTVSPTMTWEISYTMPILAVLKPNKAKTLGIQMKRLAIW